MNLLWASNWAATSAYAQQSRLFVRRLMQDGHKITVSALASSNRAPYDDDGIPVYSMLHDGLGNDIINLHAATAKAHAILSLIDVWRLDPNVWGALAWYAWCPVDHMPAPPLVVDRLSKARKVLALSRFGQQQLADAGVSSLYVPHAVDNDVFVPIPKDEARRKLGLAEDKFIALFVGVNDSVPSRKGIPELLMAWQEFLSYSHSTDVMLYLHTGRNGHLPVNSIGGVKLDTVIATLMLNNGTIFLTDQTQYWLGYPQSHVALLYAAADVLVLPTRGEGFGMPLIEAQAMGTPVITTNFAAGAELVHAGWTVTGTPEWGYQDAFVMRPEPHEIATALQAAYEARGNPALREQAIEGMKAYAFEHVYPTYFKPAMDLIAEDVLDRSVSA